MPEIIAVEAMPVKRLQEAYEGMRPVKYQGEFWQVTDVQHPEEGRAGYRYFGIRVDESGAPL